MAAIEYFWESVKEFFSSLTAIFWAVVFGGIVERISEELGRRNINIVQLNDKSPFHQIIRICNFSFRLICSFFIGLVFIIVLILIVALLSGFIGFIIQ